MSRTISYKKLNALEIYKSEEKRKIFSLGLVLVVWFGLGVAIMRLIIN